MVESLPQPSPQASTPASARPFPPGTPVFGEASGCFAEQLAVNPSALHRVPDGWSLLDAAGVAATLPVAYGALVLRGRVRAGETVLVLGAAGGLGIMAVQVAAALGCRVIGVVSTETKCKVVRGLAQDLELEDGSLTCIDSSAAKGKEWWELVMEKTENRGVDVAFDPVGLVDMSLKCLAHRGRILITGFAGRDAASMENIKMNRVLLKQAELIGYVSLSPDWDGRKKKLKGDEETELYLTGTDEIISGLEKAIADIRKKRRGSGRNCGHLSKQKRSGLPYTTKSTRGLRAYRGPFKTSQRGRFGVKWSSK